MVKKMMVGLLIAMVGVCFADYKSQFNFNLNDSAKIDKFLAEATAAKDTRWINVYSKLKLVVGKDSNNMSYDEFKKLLSNAGYQVVPQFAVQIKRFNAFIPNVLNDSKLANNSYVLFHYSSNANLFNTLGFKVWREKLLNIIYLRDIQSVLQAKSIVKYYKNNNNSLSAAEIKADCAIFKRAWYLNITKSEEWKKLLVEIELMIKSVE